MTSEDAKALVAKHGTVTAAAKAAGVPKSTFYDWTRKGGKTVKAIPGHTVKIRSLSEFKQTVDKDTIVPSRIREGLKVIGAMGWVYEVEFCKLAKISSSDLGNYRDSFADFVVPIKERRAWAGSKSMADKLRAML
jgi:hypothetical protein